MKEEKTPYDYFIAMCAVIGAVAAFFIALWFAFV